MRRSLLALALLLAGDLAAQQQQRLGPPMSPAALRTRLSAYADDSMLGRSAGTPAAMKATAYIADELRKAGLKPAGENGTFFQDVPLSTAAFDTTSGLRLNGEALIPFKDFLPRNQGPNARSLDGASLIYVGVWGDTARMKKGADVKGKVVLLAVPASNYQVIKLQAQAVFADAAAIVIANLDLMPPELIAALSGSAVTYGAETAGGPVLPAYTHIPVALAARILGVTSLADAVPGTELGAVLSGSIRFKRIPAPARNVIALLEGSDKTLRSEYVAVGAHSDHVGTGPALDRDSLQAFMREFRSKEINAPNGQMTQALYNSIRVNMDSIRKLHPTPRLDSIFNGADDDGSGSMGLLEVARAIATSKTKPKRSVLFVWHTAEELGLFGSAHFTDNPTVARDQIIAQINIDMIGRGKAGDELGGGPNYLQLIGSRRLSTQLGDLVEAVSKSKGFNWAFDYKYDANGHPEQYYCRSDHYNYARYGIPIVFMSTGGHSEYHQVTDEVSEIDFEKLAKVSRFTHDLALELANAPSRPALDKPKGDPKARCVQ